MLHLVLLLASAALAAKRSAYFPVYSLPTPYVFSDPFYYNAPTVFNSPPYIPLPPLTAVVDVRNYEGDEVTGRVTLTQPPGGPVILMGNVTGLPAGTHGLHIHEFGDLSKGCDSLGRHYNPTGTHHGGPADPYRHVGDLGSINADSDGKAKISDSDHLIALTGPHSVIGRGLVIHAEKDDYGRGGDKESLATGNSGKRLACGVIVWAQPLLPPGFKPPTEPDSPPASGEPDAEQINP